MSAAEWDALPWWQQRLYLEGMAEEFDPDYEPAREVSGDRDTLSGLGFTVK